MTTTTPTTPAARSFARWLQGPDGGELLDAAVLGYLSQDELAEIAEDYGVTYKTAARLVRVALAEGN